MRPSARRPTALANERGRPNGISVCVRSSARGVSAPPAGERLCQSVMDRASRLRRRSQSSSIARRGAGNNDGRSAANLTECTERTEERTGLDGAHGAYGWFPSPCQGEGRGVRVPSSAPGHLPWSEHFGRPVSLAAVLAGSLNYVITLCELPLDSGRVAPIGVLLDAGARAAARRWEVALGAGVELSGETVSSREIDRRRPGVVTNWSAVRIPGSVSVQRLGSRVRKRTKGVSTRGSISANGCNTRVGNARQRCGGGSPPARARRATAR